MTATARTQYIDNVKKGIEIYAAMEALKDNESLYIKVANDKVYEIHCSIYSNDRSVYSIGDCKLFGNRMNIDMNKSNKTSLYCYTFDLFNNKSSHRVYFQDTELTTKLEENAK